MPRCKPKTQNAAPALPTSHLIRLHEAGFEVVSFLDKSVLVDLPPVCPMDEGQQREEWLPRLAIAQGSDGTGYRVLEWLPKGHAANAYGFDGWQPSDGHAVGGMHVDVHGALSWFDWIVKQRADELSPARAA